MQFQRGQQFLLPQAPMRTRSLSDTSLRPPPVWNTMPTADQRQAGTVNLNDVLPGPGQGSSRDPLQDYPQPSSAGPAQTTFGQANAFHYASDYLTVDAPGAIRRAKSDGGQQRGMHTRQARSLDFRPGTLSPQPGMMFPPASHTQQEFLQRQRQFLHPTEPVQSITRGQHHRRSSSGSRERGIGGMMGLGGGGGMVGNVAGWTGSSASSARASPYPSPSASPRFNPGALPPQDLGLSGLAGPGMGSMMGMGMGMPPSLSGQMGMASPNMAAGSVNGQITVRSRQGVLQVDMPGAEGGVPMTVTRPHVTTPSTAKASHDRRKQPANFACPVPGCGSTFTRHFNLKGAWSSCVSRVGVADWFASLSLSFYLSSPLPSSPFPLPRVRVGTAWGRCVRHAQVIYARMRRRSRTSASGPGAARASRGSTTASGTSSSISTSGRTPARGARRTLRGWTRSTGIVSTLLSLHLPSPSPIPPLPSPMSSRVVLAVAAPPPSLLLFRIRVAHFFDIRRTWG